MNTILVPTDFSATAANALAYAVAIASVTKAKILLAHVIDIPPVATLQEMNPELIRVQMLADCETKLQALAEQVRSSATVEIETVCKSGQLTPHLNTLVNTHSADLVVIGSHGVSGIRDRLFGTNALAYMNNAPCPVLVVPSKATFNGIEKIAFAYDLDSESTYVLEKLFQFAGTFKAHVAVFNALSEKQLNIVPDLPLLQYIADRFPEENYSLVQRKEDDVVQGILDFVQENQVHLVAISTHERIFLEKLLHTSVTKQLLFKTEVPLLALQEKPHRMGAKARPHLKAL